MDNITHSLVGGLIGARLTHNKPLVRSAIITASILANNFPDADMVYASFLSKPFGYLLHHRGHTHTLIGAILCGLLVWLFIQGLFYIRKTPLDRKNTLYVGFVSVLGGFVHIGLDFLNTYGVHPFWPFSNNWFYGDTIFIIEPTIWIGLSLAIYHLAENRFLKIIAALPSFLGILLICFTGKVPLPIIVVTGIILGVILLISFKSELKNKSDLWSLICILILLSFFVCGKLAKSRLETSGKIINSFVIPSPANPFCWSYLQMSMEDNLVKYKRGIIPIFSFIDLKCENYTLYKNINDQNEYLKIPYQIFQEAVDNCRWQAFLKFSRIPSLKSCGNLTCMTDQRFNRDGSNDFSTFTLNGSCPDNLPPWNNIVDLK